MALTARSMKPVRVENVVMPSVDMAQPKERQIFRHDVDVMVFLTEMKGRVNCGHGRGPTTGAGSRSVGTRASVTCALGCRTSRSSRSA